MDKRELQKLLSQPYRQENWKEIVQFVFPNVSILSTPKEFPINNNKIKKFCQIGNVRLNDGKNLALFELILDDSVNLQRNRVELNNEISKYIDQEQIHGVLSVFEQGGDDYRFTFSARSTEFDEEESDFVQKKTDTKRFTYVLGKNESCKTPADRFYKLSEKKSEADINAIQHAFSVEQLSKEFFDKYKKQFDKFWTYINTNEDYKTIFFGNDREKSIRDFTKKLLGRIVFLHFLQKKGWMGCAAGTSAWENGDKQFMQNLLEAFEDKEHFHSRCLAELFYNTLNRKRTDDLFVCEDLGDSLNKTKIPYLNGGLFDSDEDESRKIDFPTKYFEELLEFFGQYNFTIDENDPNDHEVGIDPEMLGHIFENLLEDNKDKGAFYTPKVIVQFMCQESLIEYILTKLNSTKNIEIKEAVEDLVRNRLAEKCSDSDLVESIAQTLYDVKICDPAIGSGAFPMGILNTIYQVVEELYWIQPDSVARVWNISDTEWQPHLVKKNIIQHSIYGVDLESGAIDIARLRFWLALVVDETEPLPLPNLDYKIMQGNSLLESFEGVDLSKISDAAAYEAVYESDQIDMFSGEAKKKVSISLNFEDIKALMNEYFNANDPEVKKDLHKRIDDQVLNHIRFTLTQHKKELKSKSKKLEKKINLDESSASTWQQKEKIRTTSKEAKALDKISKELEKSLEKETKLSKLSNSNERPFFLWQLFFQEVFDKGGVDIVIGNPPYIKEYTLKSAFDGLHSSPYYQGKMDIWYFFASFCIDLVKEDSGIQCFIAQNNWITSSGASKFRNKILIDTEIKLFVDFGDYKVFKSAGIQTMIYLLKNRINPVESHVNYKKLLTKEITSSQLVDFLSANESSNLYLSYTSLIQHQEYIDEMISFNSPKVLGILNKFLEVKHLNLIDSEVAQGIVPNPDVVNSRNVKKISKTKISNNHIEVGDGVFVVDKGRFSNKRYVKPLIEPRETGRYKTVENYSSEILYITKGDDISNSTELIKHLEKYREIMDSRRENLNGRLDYYNLHWPRDKRFFEKGGKILGVRKCETPSFTYTTNEIYVMMAFNVIKTDRINQLFLTGFLNSRMAKFWFKYKGKLQGSQFQIDKEPLLNVPIPIECNIEKISKLVSDIYDTDIKSSAFNALEKEIDTELFKYYNLSEDDIEFIYRKTNDI